MNPLHFTSYLREYIMHVEGKSVMKRTNRHLLELTLVLVVSIVAYSCSGETEPNTIIYPSSILPGYQADSITKRLLYSFDTDAIMPDSVFATDQWDMLIPYVNSDKPETIRRVDIMFNSGSVNSLGKTKGKMLSEQYDNVIIPPADSLLRMDDTATTNRISSVNLLGDGMFNYSGAPLHLITANTSKCIVVKTAKGRYVKITFLSFLLDRTKDYDKLNNPVGFIHVKYIKDIAGKFK